MGLAILKIIKYLFVPFGVIYSFFRRKRNEVIILLYHRVNDRYHTERDVTVGNFCWQMDYLKRRGYTVISMDEAYDRIMAGEIHGRYAVLTFDDGYEDFYLNAYPVLKQHGFPSTVYLATGYIETNRTYWWDMDIGESRLMNWKQIEELSGSGIVDFGSHTINHSNPCKSSKAEWRKELYMSRKTLEDRLKKRIRHFAYPGGAYSKLSEKMVKKYYDTGVLIFRGDKVTSNIRPDSRAKLKRMPVQRSDGKYLFPARLNGWLILEEIARRLLNKL